jgi:hypothetical protein
MSNQQPFLSSTMQAQVPPAARRMLELTILMAALEPARCPITGNLTPDPVILAGTGLSYDRAAITAFFEANGFVDPATGDPLDESQRRLLPNPALAGMVNDMVNRILVLLYQEAGEEGIAAVESGNDMDPVVLE